MWLIIILSVLFAYYWFNLKPKNFPPGPPILPFVGSLPFMPKKYLHFYLEKARLKYGPIIGFKLGPVINACGICGPEEVIEALKKEEFNGRPQSIVDFRGAPGVMFASGQHWKDQRRFTLRHLRDFGFGTSSVSDLVAQEVDEFCGYKLKGKGVVQGSGIFNISAINILWAMIAGKRNSYDDPVFQELLNDLTAFIRQGSVIQNTVAIPYLKNLIAFFYTSESDVTEKKLADFFTRAIEEHKATKTDEPRDLMDAYLNELEKSNTKESFSARTLLEIVRDLFGAGTESSSNTLSFAIMYLIMHPEWQDKLYAEVQENLGGTLPRIEDRQRFPLVEAFIAEVMRSNTIAPLAVPHAATEDTTFHGYFIPKGTFILISIWSLLQDKKHWGDPENFRPERHLTEENTLKKDPYLSTFGIGSRVCLGETLARNFVFLVFVMLLQRYKFSLPKGHDKPSTISEPGFTAAPKQFMFAFEAR